MARSLAGAGRDARASGWTAARGGWVRRPRSTGRRVTLAPVRRPSPRRWLSTSTRSASTCRSGCRRRVGASATCSPRRCSGGRTRGCSWRRPAACSRPTTYDGGGPAAPGADRRARPVGADLAPGAEDPRGRRGGGRPAAGRGAPRAQPGRARRCRAAAVEEDRRRAGGPGGPADRLARRRACRGRACRATTGWTRWPSPGRRTDGWPAGPGRCPAYRPYDERAGRCGSSPDAGSGGGGGLRLRVDDARRSRRSGTGAPRRSAAPGARSCGCSACRSGGTT